MNKTITQTIAEIDTAIRNIGHNEKEYTIRNLLAERKQGIIEGAELQTKEILEIIDSFSELESCPYCSAILKQSHYCDNCQQGVSSPTDLLELTEELKEKIQALTKQKEEIGK